jgi:multidrug efflux pump subunit AcrB
MLIGLVCKNAIMLVDYMNQERAGRNDKNSFNSS